ncbi:MAG: hypothetical protein JWO06_2573, partial [Bacteroidota bacterium]|nr:hypothetical protein [Bacteroidota bacterium]
NPGNVSVDVTLLPESPYINSTITTYSIYCSSESLYVQPSGTLGAVEVFQTRAAWGTVHVTGLNPNTNYCFYAKARNQDGDIRISEGTPFSFFEGWDTNILDTTTASPTNVWWSSDTSVSSPMQYFVSGGCPGAKVGFSGSSNNNWHSFLRSPAVNCSTVNQVNLNVDISNSFFPSHPNDRVTFTLFAPTSSFPLGTFINALAVNGILGSTLPFDSVRNCQTISVTYDLSQVTDKSGVLLYINAFCGYNDANVFSVSFDNINIGATGGPNTSCIGTTTCSPAVILTNPSDKNICVNGSTSFGTTAGGYIASYQWQLSTNGGSNWNNVSNTGVYSNANTPTLNITGANANMNNYQYRCAVSDTCVRTVYSSVAILTVSPSLTGGAISGLTTVCAGQNNVVYTTALLNGASYSWSLPSGATIVGAGTGDTVIVDFGSNSITGNIVVTPTNVCGLGQTSNPLNITVNHVPVSPSFVIGDTLPCRSSTQSYLAGAVTGALSYTWTLPSGWSGTSSVDSIHATIGAGSGNIAVTANNGCGSSIPQTLHVNVITSSPPTPGAIIGPDSACSGTPIIYSIPPLANVSSYTWSLPNGWTGSSLTDSINAFVGNNGGNITVRSNNSCGTSSPRIKNIGVKPGTPVSFNYSGNAICSHASPVSLTGSPAGGIYNGPGVINDTFDPSLAFIGDNVVNYIYTAANGCISRDTADFTVKVCTGIAETGSVSIEIYPNPFSGYFTIAISNIPVKSIAKIYDYTGREVRSYNLPADVNAFNVNGDGLQSGVYLLDIISEGGSIAVKKLVKVN